jgi:hypothetical protein
MLNTRFTWHARRWEVLDNQKTGALRSEHVTGLHAGWGSGGAGQAVDCFGPGHVTETASFQLDPVGGTILPLEAKESRLSW